MTIAQLRRDYHNQICTEIIRINRNKKSGQEYPNFADGSSKASLDCVYHFALKELIEAAEEVKNEDQLDMLMILVEGKRLRDISDLPFDMAI